MKSETLKLVSDEDMERVSGELLSKPSIKPFLKRIVKGVLECAIMNAGGRCECPTEDFYDYEREMMEEMTEEAKGLVDGTEQTIVVTHPDMGESVVENLKELIKQ